MTHRFVLLLLAVLSGGPAHAGTIYDGAWSVVVYTASGPCDPSYRISGQITDGRIYYAYGSIEVSGRVAAGGDTHVHVTAGSSHGEARGHMTATRGNGSWSGQGPDGRCAGTWVATRPNTTGN
jgi:hypothetical protein